MTPKLRLTLILSLAGASLAFGQSTSNTNQGGPPVAKRNYTPQEIQQVLKSYGVTSQSSGPVSCFITDSTGATVTTISASNYAAGPFYWMNYESAGVTSTAVEFVAVPMFTGSPLPATRQNFAPNSDTNIETPFGIPYWGGNLTSGPWMLVVHNNSNQYGTCAFTVTSGT
jgi:hypothetical protein